MHAPGDVRVEDREDARIVAPTDAVVRLAATCACGSDLWPYRGIEKIEGQTPMGHEYVGVVEEVGAQESMMQAMHSTRPGGHVGFVGVTHEVALPGMELFFSHVHLHGGPAPVRRFLPELIDLVWDRRIDPRRVFDLTLPLDQAAEGYRAVDERRAIKTLLTF